MRCPDCGDEYEDGVDRCADCRVPLVAADGPPPPRVDALLGTFHPHAAGQVVELLDDRGVQHDTVTAEGRVEVIVDRTWRDDLRAELVVNWGSLLHRLPPDERTEVAASGGRQPGWYDAPEGAWIDRDGRLQVEVHEDEAREEDAKRVLGPSLATLGGILAVFGWYAGGSPTAIFLGVVLLAIGLLLPR